MLRRGEVCIGGTYGDSGAEFFSCYGYHLDDGACMSMSASQSKVLICRISWMNEYCGLANDAIIAPAGRFPKENGWGGECWNFKAWRGRMYGYVRVNSRGDPTPVVRRLNSGTVAESVDDVTVVWVAHNGAIEETYVIGWFERSTVYAQFLDRPDAQRIADEAYTAGVDIEVGQEELQYFVKCRKEDARLLTVSERAFPVPTGRGWMARQSLLFYPDRGVEHERFKDRLLDYIAARTHSVPSSPSPYLEADELLDGHSTVEGKQVFVTHVARERDRGLANKAKQMFKKAHGRLSCEACGFDFEAEYGPLGKDYIEAHHVTPLAEGTRETSTDDLMMLCANCHRMVHRQINKQGRNLTREESAEIASRGGNG